MKQSRDSQTPKVLLVGPLPPPPLLGGIATGVDLLLKSDLASKTCMALFNTARDQDLSRPIYRKIIYQLSMSWQYLLSIHKSRPDIVHIKTASGINFYQNALYALLAKLFRRRVLLQIHSGGFPIFYEKSNRAQQWLIRMALRVPHRLVALSGAWSTYFKKLSGVQNVSVVCNALSVEHFVYTNVDRKSYGIPKERVVVLFMGARSPSLDFNKGLKELVTAIADVRTRKPNLMLVLAGKASHDQMLNQLLGTRGEAWISLGLITGEEKASLYRSVDIFALPSYYENMPNTVLEAMAAGLAIVATPVGAIPEMIEDEVSGLFVECGETDALIQQIERLAFDRRLCRSLGLAARQVARDRFDFPVLERQLFREYLFLQNNGI